MATKLFIILNKVLDKHQHRIHIQYISFMRKWTCRQNFQTKIPQTGAQFWRYYVRSRTCTKYFQSRFEVMVLSGESRNGAKFSERTNKFRLFPPRKNVTQLLPLTMVLWDYYGAMVNDVNYIPSFIPRRVAKCRKGVLCVWKSENTSINFSFYRRTISIHTNLPARWQRHKNLYLYLRIVNCKQVSNTITIFTVWIDTISIDIFLRPVVFFSTNFDTMEDKIMSLYCANK